MNNKVCHITSAHNKDDVRIFIKECRSLAKNNFDISLIVANGYDDEIKEGVKIYDIGKTKGRLNRFFSITKKIYNKAIELDCLVYHFHDPELIPVGLMLKRKGKKVIYDVHEDLPRQILSKFYIPIVFRKPISYIIERFENYSARKFDKIITATPYIKDRFLKINANAIDINNFPLLTEFNKENKDWINKKDQICYIGAMTKVRGMVELVEAVGNIDVKLVLAGRYQPIGLKKELMELESWDESKINDKGFVSREEVNSILESSKVGVVTLHPIINYLDSLPIKMFEYMAAGIPFVASNFPYWEEIVKENKCGICVNPLSPDDIANGIIKILENPIEAKQMGQNGRKAIEEKYNWGIEEQKLVSLYKELIN